VIERLIPLMMLLALAACDSGVRETGWPVRRDSAGVAIVENSAEATFSLDRWSVDSALDLRIGDAGDSTGAAFSGITAVVALPTGEIVVLDRSTQEIRYFSATGSFLRSVGRAGDGPGEFRSMRLIPALRYDSLIVMDGSRSRFTVVRHNGEMVHSRSARPVTGQPLGWLALGRLITRNTVLVGSARETRVVSQPFSVLAAHLESGLVDTLARDSLLSVVSNSSDGRTTINQIPFTVAQSAAAGNGSIYVARGRTSDIEVYDSAGRFSRKFTVHAGDQELLGHEFESAIESLAKFAGDPPAARGAFNSIPPVRTLPVWTNVLVDYSGLIWVERYRRTTAQPWLWSVFSPQGDALGSVEVPRDFAMRYIGEDFILGTWRDEDRIEYVQRHRLQRPKPARTALR
jgi:hypothetical protein